MLTGYMVLLEGVVAEPGAVLVKLPVLSDSERERMVSWNDTASDYPREACIHELFEAQAVKNPDAVPKPVSETDKRKSYGPEDFDWTKPVPGGPLDQGFWPDGLYTAPTEEAMVYDLKVTKEMGFNMLRKHVKVEPRRFYYWTDKMGLLVWQDMPSFGAGKDGVQSFCEKIFRQPIGPHGKHAVLFQVLRQLSQAFLCIEMYVGLVQDVGRGVVYIE